MDSLEQVLEAEEHFLMVFSPLEDKRFPGPPREEAMPRGLVDQLKNQKRLLRGLWML